MLTLAQIWTDLFEHLSNVPEDVLVILRGDLCDLQGRHTGKAVKGRWADRYRIGLALSCALA